MGQDKRADWGGKRKRKGGRSNSITMSGKKPAFSTRLLIDGD